MMLPSQQHLFNCAAPGQRVRELRVPQHARETGAGLSVRHLFTPKLVPTWFVVCAQFLTSGCENCGFFGMDGDRERVADCTTPNFQSLLSVVDPASSWAAKWQHLSARLATP
jgi:Spt4/RpoE2 zinc finger